MLLLAFNRRLGHLSAAQEADARCLCSKLLVKRSYRRHTPQGAGCSSLLRCLIYEPLRHLSTSSWRAGRSSASPGWREQAVAVPATSGSSSLPYHLRDVAKEHSADTTSPTERDQASTSGIASQLRLREGRRGSGLSDRQGNRQARPPSSVISPSPAPSQPHIDVDELVRQLRSDPARRSDSADNGAEPSTSSDATIRDQLSAHGIILKRYQPDQYNNLICPRCKGGQSSEQSFAVHISDDSTEAKWICHRGTCGWTGGCSITSASPSTSGICMATQWHMS